MLEYRASIFDGMKLDSCNIIISFFHRDKVIVSGKTKALFNEKITDAAILCLNGIEQLQLLFIRNIVNLNGRLIIFQQMELDSYLFAVLRNCRPVTFESVPLHLNIFRSIQCFIPAESERRRKSKRPQFSATAKYAWFGETAQRNPSSKPNAFFDSHGNEPKGLKL